MKISTSWQAGISLGLCKLQGLSWDINTDIFFGVFCCPIFLISRFFLNLNVKKRQLPVKKRQLPMKKMGNWRFFTFKRQFVVKLEKLDNAKYTLKLSVNGCHKNNLIIFPLHQRCPCLILSKKALANGGISMEMVLAGLRDGYSWEFQVYTSFKPASTISTDIPRNIPGKIPPLARTFLKT